ncbi:MAG: hypothetical protein ACD_76C00134G0003 [uncultured bacterium]|nr:MAG: hypothetical protein ACD_76C00134G0003 [uncultured bacterium]HBD04832.1 ribosome recycling factor [Candidatus Uhrbacteria bacterium]
MSDFIRTKQDAFEQAIEHYRLDIQTLRTGRATPVLVEHIQVEAYGTFQPMLSVASINVPDPQTLVIEPWDRSILKNIETAIQKSGLGINPVIQQNIVRLSMPQMTEENRKNLARQLGEKSEAAKVAVRKIREEIRQEIVQREKDKEISEDEKFAQQEELDKTTKEYTGKIEQMDKDKEAEIMKI